MVVIPQYSFPCNGTIHKIEYYASGPSTILVSVWRHTGDGLSAQMVHSIRLSPEEIGKQEVYLDQALLVQEGDFIGAGTLGSSDSLPIAAAGEGQLGVLQSELKDAMIIGMDDLDMDSGPVIYLNTQKFVRMVLGLNVQYTTTGRVPGINKFSVL